METRPRNEAKEILSFAWRLIGILDSGGSHTDDSSQRYYGDESAGFHAQGTDSEFNVLGNKGEERPRPSRVMSMQLLKSMLERGRLGGLPLEAPDRQTLTQLM